MRRGYDEDEDPAENQARALFEIADALRDLLCGLKCSPSGGMSIAEAIEVSAREMTAGASEIASAIDRHADEVNALAATNQKAGGR